MFSTRDRPALIFMWEQFAPYHVDRLEAMAERFGQAFRVVGIEVASKSLTYAWTPSSSSDRFERHLLFEGANAEEIPWRKKLVRSFRVIRRYKVGGVFMCNQEHPEILGLLMILQLFRIRCFAMMDAKFDDRQRHVLTEALKTFVFRLYAGGLVGSQRHVSYFRFLGLTEKWISPGYLTVSLDRIRREAAVPLAPNGSAHGERHFVLVARFVEKKDIATAIKAYARFRLTHPGTSRRLLLCGDGPLEADLRAIAPAGVEFMGFLSSESVSRTIARSLALILPSRSEQWGLVVNEAVALHIPVLCSDNVGARDQLVRTGVNGFVFEAGNVDGLTRLMGFLADDEVLWRQMCEASAKFAPSADVTAFTDGVARLVLPPSDRGIVGVVQTDPPHALTAAE